MLTDYRVVATHDANNFCTHSPLFSPNPPTSSPGSPPHSEGQGASTDNGPPDGTNLRYQNSRTEKINTTLKRWEMTINFTYRV